MLMRILVCTAPYLFAVVVSCGVNHALHNKPSASIEAERDAMTLKLKESEHAFRR